MLSNEELLKVKGGSLSGPVIEGLIKIMDKIYEIGTSIGDSLSKLFTKRKCVRVTIK